jgi:dihydrolipoamide dehydrogenase
MVGARFADRDSARVVVATVSFEDHGRSRIMLRKRGLLHVYAHVESGAFLGAETIGPDAEHIAHLLAWALQCKLTVARTLEVPFHHPVVEGGAAHGAARCARQARAGAHGRRRSGRLRGCVACPS